MIPPVALKAECEQDPTGLGLVAHLPPPAGDGDFVALAAKLNAPRIGQAAVWDRTVSGDALRVRGAKAEYLALTVAERAYLDFLLRADTLDLSYPALRQELGALFGPATMTRAAWLALIQHPASRAETLFGEGARVTYVDLGRAFERLTVAP